MDQIRHVALKAIYEIEEKGAYINIALKKYLSFNDLKSLDKRFIVELVYGVISRKLTLDWIVSQYSTVKIKKISSWILNILRLGIYQILFLDRIPDSAACNESVKLARRYNAKSSGFVNAVLRNISRNKNNIEYPDRKKDLLKYFSIFYSYPLWMVKMFSEIFDLKDLESFLKKSNERAKMAIRVNTLKISKEKLQDLFEKKSIKAVSGQFVDEALLLTNVGNVASLDEYKKGYFQVQDEASMLVTLLLDPHPGERILDMCSAPGGKTLHIAQKMENKGLIVAGDIYEHRLELVKKAAFRLGVSIVRAEIMDALQEDINSREFFDRVLLDAPCSGSGIIRRKPDIKWKRRKNDIGELIRVQKKMLKNASKYVKAGGTLVYSTCSIVPEENEEVINDFLKKNNNFKLVDISKKLSLRLKNKTMLPGMIKTYPHHDELDGFFICKMERMSGDS